MCIGDVASGRDFLDELSICLSRSLVHSSGFAPSGTGAVMIALNALAFPITMTASLEQDFFGAFSICSRSAAETYVGQWNSLFAHLCFMNPFSYVYLDVSVCT